MIEFDFLLFALAIPAVIFAGISKAGFGSGAAFAASAILALVLPPGIALSVMLPLLMLVDVAALPPYWRKWHAPSIRDLSIGAIPGVILGAAILTLVPADAFRVLIGVICLAFVAYQLSRSLGILKVRNWSYSTPAALATGATAGFTSFVSHAGGPPVAVFMLGQGFSKTQYQATTVFVFWIINMLKFPPYAALGLFTKETLLLALILSPFAVIGAKLGVIAHKWVTERQFFALTYVLLVITGVRLLWLGLS